MRKFISLFVTGLMALTMIASVSAEPVINTGEANVCVKPLTGEGAGSINVEIENADFGTVMYNATATVPATDDVVVTVTDTRGVVGNWSVVISGTNFSTGTLTTDFDSEALSLTDPGSTTSPSTGDLEAIGVAVPTTLSDSPLTIFTGTAVGTGTHIATYVDSLLTVPMGTLVGDYNSTLTVTLTAGDVTNPCVDEPALISPVGDIRNW